MERAEIMAVRGPLTARSIGRPGCVIGDPGLLADELVTVRTRDIRLGLVPHWSDASLARRPEFQRYDPIVIVADAFGIPRRFELTPQFDREGGLFKFRDYHASIGMPLKIGETQQANWNIVEDRKSELFDVFSDLGRLLRR